MNKKNNSDKKQFLINAIITNCNMRIDRNYSEQLRYTEEELNNLSVDYLANLYKKVLDNKDVKYINYHSNHFLKVNAQVPTRKNILENILKYFKETINKHRVDR